MCKFSGDKPVSVMKVTAGMLCASNRLINWEKFESERVCVRTRKMVNYACEGQSQGKL